MNQSIEQKIKINYFSSSKPLFVITSILVVLSIFILSTKPFNYGIDFTGGLLIELKTDKVIDLSEFRNLLNSQNLGEVSLQNIDSPQDILIRISISNQFTSNQLVDNIKQLIATNFADINVDYRHIDFVGPQVGEKLIKDGAYATIFSFLAIMLYIWLRFEWQYGIGILIALIHDIILSLGIINILQLEFNLTTIAALLTIIGYSVNDSVVIYDRIRENKRKFSKISLPNLINLSLNETLIRTIFTVTTTLLATLALILFGGNAIYSFSLTVFIGIIIGTYSSIYISAPILFYLDGKFSFKSISNY